MYVNLYHHRRVRANLKKTRLMTNQIARRDPTRTQALRDRFARAMVRRFRALATDITKAIVLEDVFGLKGDARIYAQQTPGPRAFNFPTSSQKVSAFMQWLRGQIEAGVLDVSNINQVGTSINAAWTNQYIDDSYRRGVARARAQLNQAGYQVPTIAATGGIAIVMQAPVHVDRVGLLYTRTFNELKGITDAMDQLISRVLAQGLADGLNPRTIARQLVAAIKGHGGDLAIRDALGRYIPAERRAEILARTEVIRAHAEGQLQEFKNWGALGVNVMAEWMTAGDNRVCPYCQANEGFRFTIEQASNMIPLHPQCRCAWVPIPVDSSGRALRQFEI